MIIAYIHGFCSSSKAKKAQIMKAELLKNYKDIKFVSLDFSDNFKIAMEELNEQTYRDMFYNEVLQIEK